VVSSTLSGKYPDVWLSPGPFLECLHNQVHRLAQIQQAGVDDEMIEGWIAQLDAVTAL
jgi:hypothetical protein